MEPQKNTWLLVGLFVVIVIALGTGIYFSVGKSDDTALPVVTQTSDEDIVDIVDQLILVEHFYENGEHIYTGSIEVPTPCHNIKSEVTVQESFPERVNISLITVPPQDGRSCAQVVTDRVFTIRYKASETAVGDNLSVTLDGKPIAFIVGGKD